MQLNLGFIAEAMREKCRYLVVDEFDRCLYLSVSPYVEGRTHLDSHIYAISWNCLKDLNCDDLKTVACIGGDLSAKQYLIDHGLNGMIVDESESLMDLICDLQAIFAKYYALESELLQLLNSDASTELLLNKCAEFFHAHISLYDPNFSLVAYSTNYLPPADDPIWAATLQNKQCAIKMVDRSRVERVPSFPDKYPKSTYIAIDEVPPHFNYGFDVGNFRFATLTIVQQKEPLRKSQHWMVDKVCEMISYKILERYNTRGGIREHVRMSIQNMLLHKSSDVVNHESSFDALGWAHDDLYRLLIVSLPKEAVGISHYLYNYENIFADWYSDCIALFFEQNIIIVLHDEAAHLSESQIKTLKDQVKLDKAVSGASIIFKTYNQIPQQYEITLNTFMFRSKRKEPVLFCQDIIPQLVTSELNYLFPVVSICHYAAVMLRDYDRENSSQLLETLTMYLLCNKSLAEAAARLYVHKSTVSYRLKCISKIVSIDYNDPVERTYLLFSCIILNDGALSAEN